MDEIAKRREARRRRILENSENRLSKISGVEQKITRSVLDAPIVHNHVESPVEDFNDFIPEQPIQSRENQIIVKKPKVKHRKIVITALAIFVNCVLWVLEAFKYDQTSMHINKIFIPLFLYEILDLLSGDEEPDNLNYIHLVLAANMKNKHIGSIIKYAQIISNIMQDVMLYFFIFICCEVVKDVLGFS